ncbi:heavy-metal-associated domain-containing protein [Thalassoroseus pseudoceratinae]|uniref:heavy-metal-associated domain-containing protein n=1 Tax=Thalassoroseus pseudoceratinae TaxID=2713176 RepID=UPI001420E7E0|nr:heavy metal-associated domain-containing protein [Thalassoroseus pseudoceratinae]
MKTLAICGLMLALAVGCSKTEPAAEATGATESAAAVTPVIYNSGEELTLEVPSMHCPFGCYPTIEKTLTELDGVEKVDLVPQEKEGEINDHRVIVKLNDEFDATKAVAALAGAGFDDAVIENKN